MRCFSLKSILGCGAGFLAAITTLVASANAAVITSTSAPNFASAQVINASDFSLSFDPNILDSSTIPHVQIVQLGRSTAGQDFYRFSHNGGTVHLDIDSSPMITNFDPWMGIWDAGGTLIADDDDGGGDPGDIAGVDVGGDYNSNLSNLSLAAGDYIIGIAAFPSTFSDAGNITGDLIPVGGTYSLVISSSNVPEPSTLAALSLMSCGIGFRSYRRRRLGMAHAKS